MYNKAEDLLNKVEEIRIDMVKYLKEYVLPSLKNKKLLEYDIELLFTNEIDELITTIVHHIDEDGDLFLVFEYEDGKKAENVEIETLRFDALCELIAFFHDTFE